MRTFRRYLVVVLAGAAGLVLAVLLAMPAFGLLSRAGHTDPHDVLALDTLPQRSVVYARDGSVLDVFHAEENRSPVKFSDLPVSIVAAVVDTEDDQFWHHHGVNVMATARAFLTDLRHGTAIQGGSTITQQLVKNTLLTDERTASRKVKEALLAVRLEDELSKQDILGQYLNTVYFGNGAYGVEAAAEEYFGEHASALTTVQAALLAGLIRNPDGYDPFRHPESARARRSYVLDRMVARGDLSAQEAATLEDTPLPTERIQITHPSNVDQYFLDEVRQRLLADPALGSTPQARYNALFRGGLKIYTTLDPAMQTDAERAFANDLPTGGGAWTGALVSVDPSTGAVRALVGGPGFDRSQYDIATEGQGRQPGSSFKAIVLAAALEAGYNPGASVDGSQPCAIPVIGGPTYIAHNAEGDATGVISIADATALSVNCAYLRIGMAVGLDKIVSMGKRLGIETTLRPLPSMSIGSEEVRPIDMAGVYATFADDGVYHRPYLVDRVLDRHGKLILKGGDAGTRVLSRQKAREEVQVLRGVIEYGTGAGEGLSGREAGGKTGTTDSFTNAWFDGFTPQLATAVWVGSPIGNVPMYSVGGQTASGNEMYYRTVFGATYPAIIWHDFMEAALANTPAIDFLPPDPDQMGDIYDVGNPEGSYTVSTTTTPSPSSTVVGPSTTLRPGTSTTLGSPSTLPRWGPSPSTTAASSGSGPPTSTPSPASAPPPTTPSPSTPPPSTPPATASSSNTSLGSGG